MDLIISIATGGLADIALDEDGRPRFNDLMFGRRKPVYVAFDVLFVDGEDVRALPLKDRLCRLSSAPGTRKETVNLKGPAWE